MNNLRTEVKAAFEKELAAHRPEPALRAEVAHTVAALENGKARRPAPVTPRFAWLAVAAAVLVTAAILLSLVATHIARQIVPSLTPPPAGISLFYVVDPHNAAVLDAFDWTGQLRGAVKMPQALDLNNGPYVMVAPDGSAFTFVNHGRTTDLDRLGRPLPHPLTGPEANYTMWSADSRGLCEIGYDAASGWRLFTRTFDGSTRLVSVLGHEDPSATQYETIACSFSADRAVVIRTLIDGGTTGLWEVRLSDGAMVASRVSSTPWPGFVVASPSGEYLAFNSYLPDGPPDTEIGALGGTPLAQLPPTFAVRAFSGDGSLALIFTGQGAQIIDWRSGRVVWSDPNTQNFGSVLADPGGSTFALAFFTETGPCQVPCSRPPQTIVLVDRDGSKLTLPFKAVALW